MKKILFYILSVGILFGLLNGCIEDPKMEPGVRGAEEPEVKMLVGDEFIMKTATTITVAAEVVKENAAEVKERGFWYGKLSPPNEGNGGTKVKYEDGGRLGIYSLTINGLESDVEYYICPYAINSEGEGMGNEISVTTTVGQVEVETMEPDPIDIYATKAKVSGQITYWGEGDIKEYGICVSSVENFSVIDTNIVCQDEVSEDGMFFCELIHLMPSRKYYVRSYVVNDFGTSYGDVYEIETKDGKPHLGKIEIPSNSIGFTSAILKSSVTNGGDETVIVSERGFYWSINPEPTLIDTFVSCSSGQGDFEVTITNLDPEQRYYVRAYAKSIFRDTVILVLGSEIVDFSTKSDKPTVRTEKITGNDMRNGNVDVRGTVSDVGESAISATGICWSATVQNPELSNANVLPLSMGVGNAFSGQLTGLKGGTTYYIRAYATNGAGTSYGDTVKITTPSVFTNLTSFTGAPRLAGSAAYFAISDYLYLLGGDLGANYTDQLYRYSILKGEWEPRKPFLGGPSKWQLGVPYGTSGVFVYGGIDENDAERAGLYYYDASNNNSWTYHKDSPSDTMVCQAIGYASGSNAYFIGGMNGDSVRADVWSLVSISIWEKKPDFPVKQYGGIAVVIDAFAYVGLGKDIAGVCNSKLWVTKDAASTWEETTTCSIYTGSILGGVACNKRIYVVDEDFYILEYNPETTLWSRKSRLPSGYPDFHGIYCVDNIIYVALGSSISLISYDPSWDNN